MWKWENTIGLQVLQKPKLIRPGRTINAITGTYAIEMGYRLTIYYILHDFLAFALYSISHVFG